MRATLRFKSLRYAMRSIKSAMTTQATMEPHCHHQRHTAHHQDHRPIAAHHDQIAMGKVNQLDNPVYHAVSQRHQRIDTANVRVR